MSVLEVNGTVISREEIRAEAAVLREEARRTGRELTLDDGLHVLERAESMLVDRVLLVNEADRLKITASPDEVEAALAMLMPRAGGVAGCRAGAADAETLAEIERRLRVDKLVDQWCATIPRPSLREIRDTYDRHRAEFHADESVVVSHIVCNVHPPEDCAEAEEKIHHAESLLRSGLPFAEVADRLSDCAGDGGRLGRVFRGQMVPAFDDVVFAAPLGHATAVFETEFGFHIALVEDRQAKGVLPFDAARPDIEEALVEGMRDRVIGAHLDELRAAATIRRTQP